ncbi:MAG: hypothetical protein Q8P67_26505 [archaeon]|nr:hypothetical protein [archaeon]
MRVSRATISEDSGLFDGSSWSGKAFRPLAEMELSAKRRDEAEKEAQHHCLAPPIPDSPELESIKYFKEVRC